MWYRLNHINALRINLSYVPKDQSIKFLLKNIENWRRWKSQFFVSAILIFFFQKKFCFIPIEISHKLTGYHGWDSIFMIIMISRKKLGVYNNMNNTVISGIFFASRTNININFDLFCRGRSLSLLIYNVFKETSLSGCAI